MALSVPCLPHWGRCYLALSVPCLPPEAVLHGSVCAPFASLRSCYLALSVPCLLHWGRVTWLYLCPVCLTEVVLPGSVCALFASLRSCYLVMSVPCLPHWGRVTWLCLCPWGRCYLALSVPCMPHWGRVTWLCLCPVCLTEVVLPSYVCALFASLRSCYLALSVPLRSMLPGSVCAPFSPWGRVAWFGLCPVCPLRSVLPGCVGAAAACVASVLWPAIMAAVTRGSSCRRRRVDLTRPMGWRLAGPVMTSCDRRRTNWVDTPRDSAMTRSMSVVGRVLCAGLNNTRLVSQGWVLNRTAWYLGHAFLGHVCARLSSELLQQQQQCNHEMYVWW